MRIAGHTPGPQASSSDWLVGMPIASKRSERRFSGEPGANKDHDVVIVDGVGQLNDIK
jgi:hypothetical protein